MEPNLHDPNQITTLAITNWRDIRKKFGIKAKNRRGHIYVIGKTGTGKSTLLLNMAVSDIKNGYGIIVIDPHGDLAEELLRFIPQERVKDTVYFNPADLEYPIGFNPLEDTPLDKHHLVASGIISVFKKLWPDFWGPRLEHILRFSLLTLMHHGGCTLLDVPKLLTDESFRRYVVKNLNDTHLRNFWTLEFEKYSKWMQSEAVSPILNKMGQFLTTIPLRNIVGQTKSTLHIRQIMDQGLICIVNLAKGKIGEDASNLLGSLLTTQIQLAALSRADIPEDHRKTCYLYVDEFHNFLTMSFADILSEARKYGVSLVLSHQYLFQLDERIKAAILGNAGTFIVFRVGVEDAQTLAKEFYPVFALQDLISLYNYHIYIKLMIDGKTSDPFSAVTLAPPESIHSYREGIISLTRKRYTRPRAEVEKAIISPKPTVWDVPKPESGQKSLFR